MNFTASLQTFALKVEQRTKVVHINTAIELQRSIKFGSELTGAPPIPVAADTVYRRRKRKSLPAGTLRDSVKLTYPDATTALIYTTLWYAPVVEDNAQGHTFASGAPHGWKMTQAAFPRVVEKVAQRFAGGG